MSGRRGSAWQVAVGVAVAWTAAMLIPVSAAAVDSDLKYAYAFKAPATNGYSLIAVASNERADGQGQIVLFVTRRDTGYRTEESAIYVFPAQLTATSLRADLGVLGKVDLKVTPSGKKKTLRSRCGGETETFSHEPVYFSGSFDFYGEEAYTDALSSHPREYPEFFSRLTCPGRGGEVVGSAFPGARLGLHARRGDFRFSLQANRNHPGKPSRFEVEVHEKRGAVSITRTVSQWGNPDAFKYDPQLKKATIDPPYPFAGDGTFDREASPANRWTGHLEVDLPGRSDQPLTGADVHATLVHACWDSGARRSPC
jgi:hypothetical protein